ncbi:unnamed protein product [Musa acuminata var. zebrina]
MLRNVQVAYNMRIVSFHYRLPDLCTSMCANETIRGGNYVYVDKTPSAFASNQLLAIDVYLRYNWTQRWDQRRHVWVKRQECGTGSPSPASVDLLFGRHHKVNTLKVNTRISSAFIV